MWLGEEEERKEMIQEDRCSQNGEENKQNTVSGRVRVETWKDGEREREAKGLKRSK